METFTNESLIESKMIDGCYCELGRTTMFYWILVRMITNAIRKEGTIYENAIQTWQKPFDMIRKGCGCGI
jgi:hypothetical protein